MRILIVSMLPDLMDASRFVGFNGYDDLAFFVAHVAIPHAAMVLVSEDYGCEEKNASYLVRLSEPFGVHEYPLTASCPTLDRLRARRGNK